MCGRYGYTSSDEDQIKKRFRLKDIPFDVVPRYNIAPGQDVCVILNRAREEMSLARWGLVPSWSKDEKIGYKMINARAETILEKPSFRGPVRRKRCLIPADYFFEWQKLERGKQPFCFHLHSKETFCFAGIWDCFRDELISCAIITTQAPERLSKIHDRVPVILPPEEERAWLSDMDPAAIQRLLTASVTEKLDMYPVSSLVNSPQNDQPNILLAQEP